jgi:single-strand DNA-binding protein
MAGNMNKVMLIGRLGRDPEMRFTPSGEPVANFSIATSRSWTDQASNERREVTEWHNIVAWRRLAETCNRFLRKGRLVYIEGRLETRSWDDRETGKKMYRTEVVAEDMQMLDTAPQGEDGMGAGDMSGDDRQSRRPSSAPPPRPDGGRDSYRDGGSPRDGGSTRDRSHLRPVSGSGAQGPDDDRHMDLDDTPF